MLRRQVSTGDQERLAALADKAFVGDFVVIANEPPSTAPCQNGHRRTDGQVGGVNGWHALTIRRYFNILGGNPETKNGFNIEGRPHSAN